MSLPYLTLPFASKGQDRKTGFSNDMELASMICVAETERKRSTVPDRENDLLFVSKLFYPLWAVPWGKSCFLLDGMKLVVDTILLLKASDPEALVENLRRNTKDREQYFRALRSERETFIGFAFRKQVSIAGYIADKEMLSDVMNFVKDTEAIATFSASQSDFFIQPKVDKENAINTVNVILEHYDKLHSEIKGLHYAIETVIQETQVHANRLQRELQEMQQDFNQQIVDLSGKVGEKTAELETKRVSEIERMTANSKRKTDSMLAEKKELERQLLRLEQDKNEYEIRKDLRRSKKDKPGEARWDVRLRQVKKQISEVKGKVDFLSNLIVTTRKENEKTTKKLSDSYRKLVDGEKTKVSNLEKSRDLKIKEKNEEIKELQQSTFALTKNIKTLIGQITLASSRIEEAEIPWETETPTLIGIPLYVICHKVGDENRYLLVPPVVAQEYKGLVMRISTSLGVSSLRSRIDSLLKSRSKSIEKLFDSLRKELEEDKELEATVNQTGMSTNLMTLADFREKLGKGLEELEDEGWIKPKEKEAVLSAYRRS